MVREDEEIRLEPKAMQVLKLLLDRRDEVVDRREILGRVWRDSFVCDEVLTNVVSQLRRAFGDSPRHPKYIQTIAKKGYRLIADVERSPPPDSVPAETERWPSATVWLLVAVLFSCIALLVGIVGTRPFPGAPDDATAIDTIAIGTFQPLFPDPELSWLETGIADLMAAGFSQTSGLRVLEPNRRSWLAPTNERAPDLIVDGSFLRIGGRLRITVHATRRSTGELLVTDSTEGAGPEELFEMVDTLVTRTATRLDLVRRDRPHLSRALRSITTSSIDAYRFYVEGLRSYYEDLDDTRALEYFTRAVELDPGFAMAAAKLVILHMNFGDYAMADFHAGQAIQHLDDLREHQRHYVQGNFYVTREENFEEALAAYRRALASDPEHVAARHNIGYILFRLERYREATAEFEQLVRVGVQFPGTYRLAMMSYAALGEFESGRRVAMQYVSRHPKKWVGYRDLAQHLMRWGKLHEARRTLEFADAQQPAETHEYDWWQLDHLLGADHESDRKSGFRRRLHSPLLGPAMAHLRGGHFRRALDSLEALVEQGGANRLAPVALNLSAGIRQETGDEETSLSAIEFVRRVASGNAPEWHSMFLESRAHARMGDLNTANAIASELERRTSSIPSHKERRRLHLLRGELALMEGESQRAIDELEAAEGLLPPRGFVFWKEVPQHVPIWYALGDAYRAAERWDDAMYCYRRIVDSTTERLTWPILYVRSFYRLAELHEARGEWKRAYANYRTFLDHWEHGELDRERIDRALTKVARLEQNPDVRADIDAVNPK